MSISLGLLLLVTALLVTIAVGVADANLRRWTAATANDVGRRLGQRTADRLPADLVGRLATRLVAAGADPRTGVASALGLQVAAALVAGVVLAVVVLVVGGRVGWIVGAFAGAGVAAAPEVILRRRTSRRRVAMARDLPRILDLLVISVEAGLGLDQALGRVVRAVPGALANEFTRLLSEVGAGVPRSEALRGLAGRCPVPELRSFVLAMVQAEAYGVSVGPLLRTQAEEIRIRQHQAAQMAAQKAPVKLLLPMVLCIFPALLVVVAGPALLSVRVLLGP